MGRYNKIKPPKEISRECWRIARDMKFKMMDETTEDLKYALLLGRMKSDKIDLPMLGKAIALHSMRGRSYASTNKALELGASYNASKWAKAFHDKSDQRRMTANFWMRSVSTSDVSSKIERFLKRKLKDICPDGAYIDHYYHRDSEEEKRPSSGLSKKGTSKGNKKFTYWAFKMSRGVLRRMRAFEIIYGDLPCVIDVAAEQDLGSPRDAWNSPTYPSGTAVLVCAKGCGFTLKTKWKDLGEVLRERDRKRLKDSRSPI